MGGGYSYRRLEATRGLEGSASVPTRFATRSRSGIGQDLAAYRDLSLPEQCVEPSGRRARMPPSTRHRKLDWPSAGTRRTACSAGPAAEFFSVLSRDARWALLTAIVPARTADAPSRCATV